MRSAHAIRPALVEDARALAEVHVESYRHTYAGIFPNAFLAALTVDPREAFWRNHLADPAPRSLTLVACDAGGRVVGFLSGGRERTGKLNMDGEIYAIYLLPEAQRRGVGTRMMATFANTLQSEGLSSMAVWVLALNPFRKFYESLSGQPIAEQTIERGGQQFSQIAYGWSDLSALCRRMEPARSEPL
jgi:ribosomal protein S18 acetylase RimI-like enzyme